MKPNLLIADGDDQLCQRHGKFLERKGYAVELTAGGVDCMARLRRSRPAVLVLAQELPWGGAAGVLCCLREEGPPVPPRVVLTTSGPDADGLHELLAAPVVYALQRPFALADLLEAVQCAASAPVLPGVNGVIRSGQSVEKMQAPAETGLTGESPAARPGVLVVDDEACVRELLRVALRPRGFDVWLAASGQEAVELYGRHRDKVVAALLDVRMPGLSGPETLKALRQIDPQLRCSFMTGDPGNDQTREWLQQSGLPVLAKPFELEKLAQVLHSLARGDGESLARVGDLARSC